MMMTNEAAVSNAESPTPKRFRPRFSIRTLAVIVTLVCCYAVCWGPTKTHGVDDVKDRLAESGTWVPEENVATALPFVIRVDNWFVDFPLNMAPGKPVPETLSKSRVYYFWFFGYVAKLPWESAVTGY